MNRIFGFMEYDAKAPKWFYTIAVWIPLGLFILLPFFLYTVTNYLGHGSTEVIAQFEVGTSASTDRGILASKFGMLFFATCLSVSLIILVITFLIYMFSENKIRVGRAGGLIKVCLRCIFGSGLGVAGTYSINMIG